MQRTGQDPLHHLLSESRRTMQDGSKEQRGITCEQPAGTKRIPLSVVLAVQPTLQGGVSFPLLCGELYVHKRLFCKTANEVVPRRSQCRCTVASLRLRWMDVSCIPSFGEGGFFRPPRRRSVCGFARQLPCHGCVAA